MRISPLLAVCALLMGTGIPAPLRAEPAIADNIILAKFDLGRLGHAPAAPKRGLPVDYLGSLNVNPDDGKGKACMADIGWKACFKGKGIKLRVDLQQAPR